MQVETPQIRWHSGPTGLNEAVMSIDFLRGNDFGSSCHVLASAGADREIKIWQVTARPKQDQAAPSDPKGVDDKGSTEENEQKKSEMKKEIPTKEQTISTETPSDKCNTEGAKENPSEQKRGSDGTIDLTDETTYPDQETKANSNQTDSNNNSTNANSKLSTSLEFVFSLSGHERSINCVRFSPNGLYLASASDDSTIIIWSRPKGAAPEWSWANISSNSDISRTLLTCGHVGDITDLAWSPDSSFLCSTSVDNCCLIWNVEKGVVEERRKDHTQYVQGAAWDPLNEFLVTEGNDRSCRVYSIQGFDMATRTSGKRVMHKCICAHIIKSRTFASPKDLTSKDSQETKEGEPSAVPPKHRMFVDDTFPAFARRPTWTPDGSYLLLPTGLFKRDHDAESVNTVFGFARGNMEEPSVHLSGQEKPSLGVRCSPLLYPLRGSSSNLFQMPLRSVFAVATLNAVVIYDTQQAHPLCSISGIHYAALTDICWSSDGLLLAIASLDGYISFVRFERDLFGTPLDRIEQMEMVRAKAKSMMVAPKPTRKKLKNEDSKNPTVIKKKQHLAQPTQSVVAASNAAQSASPSGAPHFVESPLRKAFESIPTKSNPNPLTHNSSPAVNTLQARKKRRITPVIITATASSSAGGGVSVAPLATQPPTVIDLSTDPTSKSAADSIILSKKTKDAQPSPAEDNKA